MLKFIKNIFGKKSLITDKSVIKKEDEIKEIHIYSNEEILDIFNYEINKIYSDMKEKEDTIKEMSSFLKDSDMAMANDLGFEKYKNIGVKNLALKEKNDEYNRLYSHYNEAKKYLKSDYKWISKETIDSICYNLDLEVISVKKYEGDVPLNVFNILKNFKMKYSEKFYYNYDDYNDRYMFYNSEKECHENNDYDSDYGTSTSVKNYQIVKPLNDNFNKIQPKKIILVRRDFNYKKGFYIVCEF